MANSSEENCSSPAPSPGIPLKSVSVFTTSSTSSSTSPQSTSSPTPPPTSSSGIMRGEQTIALIQLYHQHYPDIARNTQDSEGRRVRNVMWVKLAEELNAAYNTSFSVEQFKKKVQNVQCTSRQKILAGKKNLGGAELEYMKLFETEKLNWEEVSSDRGPFEDWSRVGGVEDEANGEGMEKMSNEVGENVSLEVSPNFASLHTGFKLEQFMELLGMHSPTTSMNVSDGMRHCLDSAADGSQQQQLAELLALVASTNTTSTLPLLTTEEGRASLSIGGKEHPTPTSRRKRSLPMHSGGSNNGGSSSTDSSSLSFTTADHPGIARKSKQRRDGRQNGMEIAKELDRSVVATGAKRSGARWERQMLEAQRGIAATQRQILHILSDQQQQAQSRLNISAQVNNTPPSPPVSIAGASMATIQSESACVITHAEPSTSAHLLANAICSKLEQLTAALVQIDATLKERLPPCSTKPHEQKEETNEP